MTYYTTQQKQQFLYDKLFNNGYSIPNTVKIIKEMCGIMYTKKCESIFIELIVNILYSYLRKKTIRNKLKKMNKQNKKEINNLIIEFKQKTNYAKQNTNLNINLNKNSYDLIIFFQHLQDHTYGTITLIDFARASYIIYVVMTIIKNS